MKKNIIIVILTIVSVLSIIYGQYQRAETLKYEAAAMASQKRAEEMALRAEKNMREAEEQRKIAEMKAVLALEAARNRK